MVIRPNKPTEQSHPLAAVGQSHNFNMTSGNVTPHDREFHQQTIEDIKRLNQDRMNYPSDLYRQQYGVSWHNFGNSTVIDVKTNFKFPFGGIFDFLFVVSLLTDIVYLLAAYSHFVILPNALLSPTLVDLLYSNEIIFVLINVYLVIAQPALIMISREIAENSYYRSIKQGLRR